LAFSSLQLYPGSIPARQSELGDAEAAEEQLEHLLSVPSLVTVHTLEARVTWAPLHDAPEFRALLERHR
jgi:hypothetical protein